MKCDLAIQHITDYIKDRVDAPLRVILDHHYSECALCRQELEGERELLSLFEGLPEVEPPLGFRAQVMGRIAEQPHRRTWLSRWSLPVGTTRVPFAGLALTALAAGILFTSTPIGDVMKMGSPDVSDFFPGNPAAKPAYTGQPELLFSGPAIPAQMLRGTAEINFTLKPTEDLTHGKVVLNPLTSGLTCENRGVWNGQGEVLWQGSLKAGESVTIPLKFKASRKDLHRALLHVEGDNAKQNYRRMIFIPALDLNATFDTKPLKGDWSTTEAVEELARHYGVIIVSDLKKLRSHQTELDGNAPGRAIGQLAAQRGMQWKHAKGIYNLYVDVASDSTTIAPGKPNLNR